jgi:hypothetical protein
MDIVAGDVVECIDDSNSTGRLNLGSHYIVQQNTFFGLLIIDGMVWHSSRFRKVNNTVHCGGPYVARSEYERVCKELEQRDKITEMTAVIDESGDEAIYIDGRHVESFGEIFPHDIARLSQGKPIIFKSIEVMDDDRICWPKELSDLSVQPEEPMIPKPPKFLRAGWWYAMDNDGEWWAYKNKPEVGDCQWVRNDCDGYDDYFSIKAMCGKWPLNRWQEACWRVGT